MCKKGINKMNKHPYILQPYTGRNSRHTCPECGKPNQFSRYIAAETGEILSENVGRCNRIDKCGYHFKPKQYFNENGIKPERVEACTTKPPPLHRPVSFIDAEIFNNSLQGYDKNYLLKFLYSLFDSEIVNHLINIYKIGTSSRYGGGTTVFWQIDDSDNIRTGKLIKYDSNGHRIKGHNNWAHSVLKIGNFNLKQCLFGEHLLKHGPDYKVGIVESEKTAIMLAAVLPNLLWLAAGGAEGLNAEKVKVLRGREVILFPDSSMDGSMYSKWQQKAKQFGFEISDYLEGYANEVQKSNGLDIADFLI